jgi:hypothetical protein
MFTSFFSTTSVASSNVVDCSYLTCYCNFENRPMVKCSSTNALIPAKIGLVLSWPCALRHPWSLFCNFIVLSLYSLTNFKPLALVDSVQVLSFGRHSWWKIPSLRPWLCHSMIHSMLLSVLQTNAMCTL